jgi:O-succinylbenzoate synthase
MMHIDKINLYMLRMKLQSAFETSFGRIDTRDCILVEIHDGDVIGYGECAADYDPGYSSETTGTSWFIYEEFMIPLLLGKDIQRPADIQEMLESIRGHYMAKAGLEMALWDLYGKQQGKSLRELLGGIRKQVDVGVSVGIQVSPEVLLTTVAGYMENGYRRVKIKIKPGRDVKDTGAVRQQYPDLKLQVDANSAYTLETADQLMPLDDMGLLLIEQPLSEDDLWDHSKLQAKFKTPICLDESILTPRHARQAIEMGAARVINIKPGRVGGLSQAVAIHDLCQRQNIPVWCGGMLESGVGRASNLAVASLPNFKLPGDISATERYFPQDITNEVFVLNPDSTITVPDKPGLGITIDHKALKGMTLKQEMFSS